MAKTLTKAALDKLFVGCSEIALGTPGVFSSTTFADPDLIYTIKDSISFSHAAPTKTELNVDQFDAAIKATYEKGEFSITGNIPSTAKEILEYFFPKNAPSVPITMDGWTFGTGIDLDTKVVEVPVRITNKDKTMAIVIPRCEMVANFTGDSSNNTTPLAVQFTMTPLANLTAGAGGEVLFYDKTVGGEG